MRYVLAITTLTLVTSSIAVGQIDPTKLLWTNCGSCPQSSEVIASGAVVTVGAAGRAETGPQPSSMHVASTLLPPSPSYTITFQYNLSTWDSYNAPGTPNPPFNGGTGFWDSFSLSISNKPYWQLSLSDPLTPSQIPGLGFLWGGPSFGDHSIKSNSGTKTVTIVGNPAGNNYLNVGLDTATPPENDTNFPSWGTFTIVSIKTACSDSDISTISGVPAYYQCGNPFHTQWWKSPYDHETGVNICNDGCAMTALAMLLSYYGHPFSPETLNATLNSYTNLATGTGYGYTNDGYVNFSIVSVLTGNGLEYMREDNNDTTDLDADLCSGKPVILDVGGHFVLAIGKTSGSYVINDPGHINVHSLDFYGGAFSSKRRFVPPGSGAFVIYASAGVQVLVTDPLGRQVGYSGGNIVNQILGASYGDELILDDDPIFGLPLSLHPDHVVFIPTPSEGFYTIQTTGVLPGPGSLEVYRFTKQNIPQSKQVFATNLGIGQSSTVTTAYSTRTGDVNGDGFVNSQDLAVVRASFGMRLGQPGYNPPADVNGDGIVDIRDLALVARFDPPQTSTPVLAPRP